MNIWAQMREAVIDASNSQPALPESDNRKFIVRLREIIIECGLDARIDVPAYVLADYLDDCLAALERAQERIQYGEREP